MDSQIPINSGDCTYIPPSKGYCCYLQSNQEVVDWMLGTVRLQIRTICLVLIHLLTTLTIHPDVTKPHELYTEHISDVHEWYALSWFPELSFTNNGSFDTFFVAISMSPTSESCKYALVLEAESFIPHIPIYVFTVYGRIGQRTQNLYLHTVIEFNSQSVSSRHNIKLPRILTAIQCEPQCSDAKHDWNHITIIQHPFMRWFKCSIGNTEGIRNCIGFSFTRSDSNFECEILSYSMVQKMSVDCLYREGQKVGANKNFNISSQTLEKLFFRGWSIMGTHFLTLTVSLHRKLVFEVAENRQAHFEPFCKQMGNEPNTTLQCNSRIMQTHSKITHLLSQFVNPQSPQHSLQKIVWCTRHHCHSAHDFAIKKYWIQHDQFGIVCFHFYVGITRRFPLIWTKQRGHKLDTKTWDIHWNFHFEWLTRISSKQRQ